MRWLLLGAVGYFALRALSSRNSNCQCWDTKPDGAGRMQTIWFPCPQGVPCGTRVYT